MYLEREPVNAIERYSGPYERWVFSKELGYPFAFPVLHQDYKYVAAICKGNINIDEQEDQEKVRLPPLWPKQDINRSVTPFAFLNSSDNAVDELVLEARIARALDNRFSKSRYVDLKQKPRYRVNFPIASDSWVPAGKYNIDAAMHRWETPSVTPKAIVAVIDDGIPFGHRAFLNKHGDKTRVSHCWLQSARALDEEAAVPFGREYTNSEIDGFRASAGDDDTLFYRQAGAEDLGLSELGTTIRHRMTHGAHVMGMCAGNAPIFSESLDDSAQIIAVQLPNTIAWDTSGFGKEMYMLSALHYIFNRAEAIAKATTKAGEKITELPLIINFSYGWNAGRHDGESDMEIAIKELLEQRKKKQSKTALVLPSGNTFDSKMHAQFTELDFYPTDGSVSAGWKLQPDDRTSSYLEIWFPKHFDPSKYTVTVSSPVGQTLVTQAAIPVIPDSQFDSTEDQPSSGDRRRFVELEINGKNIGQLSADLHNGTRWRVMLALIPTMYTNSEDRCTPSGLWVIKIKRDPDAKKLSNNELIDIWIQRDDDPASLGTGGRQSYIVDLSDSESLPDPLSQESNALNVVTGYGSLNSLASSEYTICVGGYVYSTELPSSYSSCGGVYLDMSGKIEVTKFREEHKQIDFMAVADQSRLQPGTSSIGVLSGSTSRLIGTSGAAPSVVRLATINAINQRPLFADLNRPEPQGDNTKKPMDMKEEARAKPDSRVRAVTRM